VRRALRLRSAGLTLPCLLKLDLRWNGLAALPAWLRPLERRGCVVYH